MAQTHFKKWKIHYKQNITKTGYDAFVVDEQGDSVRLKEIHSYSINNDDCILETKRDSIRLSNVKGHLHEIFLGMHSNLEKPPVKKEKFKWLSKFQNKIAKDSAVFWSWLVVARICSALVEGLFYTPTPTRIQQSLFEMLNVIEVILNLGIGALTISMVVGMLMYSKSTK